MLCHNCGAEVSPGETYCPECGAKMRSRRSTSSRSSSSRSLLREELEEAEAEKSRKIRKRRVRRIMKLVGMLLGFAIYFGGAYYGYNKVVGDRDIGAVLEKLGLEDLFPGLSSGSGEGKTSETETAEEKTQTEPGENPEESAEEETL